MAAREKTSKDLPDQVDRTARSRRGGSSVPATPVSLSNDGRVEECTAGSSTYSAPAKANPDGLRKRGRCYPRVVLRRVDSSESISSRGSVVSTESLEAPLPEGEGMSVSSGEENVDNPPSDEEGLAAWAAARAAKPDGRGRPPVHGRYIGLGKVRDALRDANLARKRQALEAAGGPTKKHSASGSESGRTSDAESMRRLRRSCLTVGGTDVEVECETRSSVDLVSLVYKAVNVCDEVATRAKRLKGTDVKALREAGRDGRRVLDTLYARLRDNHAARTAPALPQIYKENEELRLEVRLLREEVAALQARVSMPPPPPPAATSVGVTDDLLKKIGALIDVKLAAVLPPPAPAVGWQTKSASRAPKKGVIRTRSVSGRRGAGQAGKAAALSSSVPVSRTRPEVVDPGPSTSRVADTWSTVVGRRAKKAAKGPSGASPPAARPTPGPPPPKGPTQGPAKTKKRRVRLRAPTTAAVVVARDPSAKIDLGEALKRCRLAIPLESLGIERMGFRRTMTGDLMLQVPGPDMAAKADALAAKMEGVLAGTGVKIRRPSRPGNVRVRGIDSTVSREEVLAVLAREGGCPEGEIRLGELRALPSGLQTVWAQCPMSAAKRLAAAGRITVGWTGAQVEALKARPLRCFRCLRAGHVGQFCPSTEVDRSGRCFRCGLAGHVLRQCMAPEPRCPVCSDLGRKARHVLGGPQCDPPPARVSGVAATFVGPERLAPGVAGRAKRRRVGVFPSEGEAPGAAEGEGMEVDPPLGGAPSSPPQTPSVVTGGVSAPSGPGGLVSPGSTESIPVSAVVPLPELSEAPSPGSRPTKAQARLAALLGASLGPSKAKPGPRCSKS